MAVSTQLNQLAEERPFRHASHGALAWGETALWRVWAPKQGEVTLVTYPGGERVQTPMTPEPMGFFVHQQTPVEDGLRYAFQLPDGRELPDPASRWQPEGVHKPSAVFFADRFAWSDAAWPGIRAKIW